MFDMVLELIFFAGPSAVDGCKDRIVEAQASDSWPSFFLYIYINLIKRGIYFADAWKI